MHLQLAVEFLESSRSMMQCLLVLGILGLTTSTMYATLAVSGALRFAQRRRTAQSGEFTPPVSLLKPLHGSEQELELRLESFFQQEYPVFEILFCARSALDPGLSVAMRVAARYPHIPAKFLSCGDPPYANAKVWSLERMQRAAEPFASMMMPQSISCSSTSIQLPDRRTCVRKFVVQ